MMDAARPAQRPAVPRERGHLLAGLLWTAPWWLGFLIFLAGPLAVSLYISFCDYPLLQPPVWVGLENYQRLAHDDVFHKVLGNTLIYAAFAIPLGTVTAVALAVLLNRRVRGQALFRACVFVPTIVPLVATGLMWLWMLNPEQGLVNRLLWPARQVAAPVGDAVGRVGQARPESAGPLRDGLARVQQVSDQFAQGPTWLGAPGWAMAALVLISLWGVGSPVVIYLAGLQEIPEELYEAAELDGASGWQRFRFVTLPGLSPVILFNVIIAIIGTWQVFALPYVLMNGGPGPERGTYFYTSYLFDNAFRYLKMGYASAMGWIQLLIILALTALVFWVSRRSVHYRGS